MKLKNLTQWIMKKFEMELLNSEKSQMILGGTCTAQVTDDPCFDRSVR